MTINPAQFDSVSDAAIVFFAPGKIKWWKPEALFRDNGLQIYNGMFSIKVVFLCIYVITVYLFLQAVDNFV